MSASTGNVIELRRRGNGRFAHTIRQEDIFELIWRGQQLNQAREAYLEQRDWIKAALEAGAMVEPGVHTVAIEARNGGPMLRRFNYWRLVVT